ncbi:hypothetical protein ACFVHS_22270 [Streptomyces sp. NPDC057746]|uniref:DUF7737 domain-containing protein n=1 Tax=Streptomyces sp. NPDC057746 TaxID=3346237 RepID=UPI0036976BEA
MLYDALVAESRRNDGLDAVRSAALDRGRSLIDLLEHQRTEFRRSRGHEYRRSGAQGAATRTEIDGRLAACTDEEGRAAVLCLMLAACFDDTSLWQYEAEIGSLISRVRGWTPDEVAVMLLRATKGAGNVFLPFEDERSSLILGKAFLLAADTEITDETILRQIKRGAR